MTEEEARQKWCPFARVAWGSGGGEITACNRGSACEGEDPMNPPAARCIASRCAAWREHSFIGNVFIWAKETFDRVEAESPGLYEIIEEKPEGFLRVKQAKRTGECGLAAGAT